MSLPLRLSAPEPGWTAAAMIRHDAFPALVTDLLGDLPDVRRTAAAA